MFLPCLPMCLQALDETIQLLIDMAFTNNWFNETYEIHLSRQDLVDLLKAATKGQLFGFSMVADPDLQIRGGRSSRS